MKEIEILRVNLLKEIETLRANLDEKTKQTADFIELENQQQKLESQLAQLITELNLRKEQNSRLGSELEGVRNQLQADNKQLQQLVEDKNQQIKDLEQYKETGRRKKMIFCRNWRNKDKN
jgi:hypothetical protein